MGFSRLNFNFVTWLADEKLRRKLVLKLYSCPSNNSPLVIIIIFIVIIAATASCPSKVVRSWLKQLSTN